MGSLITMARNKYDVDETLEETYNFSHLKRLGKYIKPHAKSLVHILFLMLVTSALGMLCPLFLKRVMDIYIPNKDFASIIVMGVFTLLIALFTAFAVKIKIKVMSKVGQSVVHDLRQDLFTHLQELPFSYFDSRPHGKIQVRVVNYVNELSDICSNGLVNTITDLCSLIFITIFMISLNFRLALLVLVGLPIFSFFILAIRKIQRKKWQMQSNKQSNLNAYIAESINGIRVTQSFVRENENEKIFARLSKDYKNAWLSAVKVAFLTGPTVQIISIITTAAVYYFGISWIINGSYGMTVGTILAFTAYINHFWQPITTLADFINSLLTAISYLERIFETIDTPLTVKDCPNATIMPPIEGTIEYKDICFSYEEGSPILKNVNFVVQKGEAIAIVGPTGAGKTTIINLLSRFYNADSGQILIDGIDISNVTIKSLRTQMGVMMQDSFIFNGTILDNIRYGNDNATEEEVINAAKTVCAHNFIMQMEKGYHTEVNERGSRLSAGQRQLISFARALLANPRILILDEATSSIDTETELLVQRGLDQLLKGRTSFIIAHRLSTIKNCSRIMYIDKGNILESGEHYQLLAKQGAYYKLYMSQFELL